MNCVLWSMGDDSLHGIGTSLVPASLLGVTHVSGLNCYLCVRTVPLQVERIVQTEEETIE